MAADEVVESGVDGGVSRTLSGVGRLEARRPSELASSMGPVPTTPLPRKQTATGSMFARLSHPKVQLVFKNVHLEVKVGVASLGLSVSPLPDAHMEARIPGGGKQESTMTVEGGVVMWWWCPLL